ncbi:hypothetical protein M2132_001928 [Dysgonomonas sp. PH5-45]|uniref:DUF2156 domain-containing protein n=1 Tax=unclassified Dysgonomonas TaxID=2630389 RepID=UPI0024761981|nr:MULTISPECIES: phosphatidylglycerol lysyltransferase domain-containing protein [unclassified Dysgonomonas]MDH6355583.1 hypothetical protein [Dysgonomonas sp. PH5-45]MDH6388507.1 hypothetical protein [Dysgonomonas sp. PH5-37]
MLNFKPITLADRDTICEALAGHPYRACDFTFANLYAWNAKFKTQYTIADGTLFLRFRGACTNMFYMMPVGGQLTVKQAVEKMMADAANNGVAFSMKAITDRMWQKIETEMPGLFDYTHERENDEYIYLTEKLITLSGKKLQSKRNHINRFKADNPDWEYSSVTTQKDLDECLEMLNKWDDVHDDPGNSLEYDYIATKLMLQNFNPLELKGGAIRVNGQIIAFSLGEPLNEDTFVVHVEKAYSHINGAYTIMNQQFAMHEASEYKYINREEDMGLESLRKAKLSYQPELILQEGIVKLKA